MMLTELFPFVALTAVAFWLAASVVALKNKGVAATIVCSTVGTLVFSGLIAWTWVETERPPLRTMGEVRLWYSLFLAVIGLLVFLRTKWRWLPIVSSLLATVFVTISLCRPELFETDLMPALQSPWFVPHVAVYIFSYSLSSIATIYALWLRVRKPVRVPSASELSDERAMVMMGWALLTFGMVTGAFWAKQAWGDWWSWDPKETWAAATWMGYLLYIHRSLRCRYGAVQLTLLIVSFLMLQMCWYGLKFLSSSSTSIHVY